MIAGQEIDMENQFGHIVGPEEYAIHELEIIVL